jgi:NAD(P)-dependent dehydrogenase (short-subunit alcohol dehydrogenase family)
MGKAIALALAAEGAVIAAAARTREEIESVASSCGSASIAIQLDVTVEADCRAAIATVHRCLGHLDILVNNAGIAASAKFTDLDTATWRHIFAVDLDGPFFMTRAAIPSMVQQGSGTVINIGSIASRYGGRYVAAYTAAKHGLLGLTRALAAEYASAGITFNCVCPAYTDTPMTDQTIQTIADRTGGSRDESLKPLLTPQGRLVRPEEVAAVCILLASNAGRGITGQAINVDGGWIQS